jgi:hypothetical protein
MRSDRDPFEGLRLDEGFVRDARFIEPSAADRRHGDGITGRLDRGHVVPARSWLSRLLHGVVRVSRHRARAVAALALTLGLLSLGVLFVRQNAGRGGQNASPAGPAAGPAIETTATALYGGGKSADMSGARPADRPAPPPRANLVVPVAVAVAADDGDCLWWPSGEAGSLDAREVDCAAPHRGEVTGIIDLARRFPVWPRDDTLGDVVATACRAALPARLGAVSPKIAAWPGALHVSRVAWGGDARVLVCILGDREGAEWSGSAVQTDVAA